MPMKPMRYAIECLVNPTLDEWDEGKRHQYWEFYMGTVAPDNPHFLAHSRGLVRQLGAPHRFRIIDTQTGEILHEEGETPFDKSYYE